MASPPLGDAEFLSPAQVTALMALPEGSIYHHFKGKDPIPHIRLGRTIRVPRDQFEAWLKRNTVTAETRTRSRKAS